MNLPSSTASILLLIHFLHLHNSSFHQCPRFFNLQLYCLPSPSCVACPADLNSMLLGWLSHFPALCSMSRLAFPWLMLSPAAQYMASGQAYLGEEALKQFDELELTYNELAGASGVVDGMDDGCMLDDRFPGFHGQYVLCLQHVVCVGWCVRACVEGQLLLRQWNVVVAWEVTHRDV
jgi:hypothetical protein